MAMVYIIDKRCPRCNLRLYATPPDLTGVVHTYCLGCMESQCDHEGVLVSMVSAGGEEEVS